MSENEVKDEDGLAHAILLISVSGQDLRNFVTLV
jgi:hypothetical protein